MAPGFLFLPSCVNRAVSRSFQWPWHSPGWDTRGRDTRAVSLSRPAPTAPTARGHGDRRAETPGGRSTIHNCLWTGKHQAMSRFTVGRIIRNATK